MACLTAVGSAACSMLRVTSASCGEAKKRPASGRTDVAPCASGLFPSFSSSKSSLNSRRIQQTPRKSRLVTRMAPDEEKMTKRSPLDFPIEWERPGPGRRPDIFPQFSPMKPPLPQPLPMDPPFEEDEDEEKKDPEEDPEEEPEQPEE